MDKAYKYQKILTELRKNEDTDTSDMSITDENGIQQSCGLMI